MTLLVIACALLAVDPSPASADGASTNAPSAPVADEGAPTPDARRVGGDMKTRVESTPDGYRSGDMRITTPLPAGYPPPTPADAIEIKRYPVVRRAEVTMQGSTDGDGGFWPLFRHIQRRDIAMTSPVEIDYHGMNAEEAGADRPDSSTMSFLYRTSDMGAPEQDGRVTVRDVEPLTVIAIGFRGAYGFERAKPRLAALRAWLDANPAWVQAGDPRMLCYNGPDTRRSRLWGEVQIPIRPATVSPEASPAQTDPVSPANQ